MNFRKISIITPSFNRRDMLEGVVKNVMAQDYPNMEHIVVDGGSSDGTQDMIKGYPHVIFICETDRGMYDALNKGLIISTGEIIGFLNTDDWYVDDILHEVAAGFNDGGMMALAGEAEVIKGNGNLVERYSPKDESLLDASTIGSNFFNAWFFRRSVFEKIGGFNLEYRIAGDRDLMLRFALRRLPYSVMNRVTYLYRKHVESLTFHDTDENRETTVKEQLDMTSRYLKENGLSALERRRLIQLRTHDTVDMATRSLRKFKIGKFFYYLFEGTKQDVFWLAKFIWSVVSYRVKWLYKKLKATGETA